MSDFEVVICAQEDQPVDSSCQKTESFTKLLDYCKDTSWKDNNSQKDVWICNDSKNASLYNSSVTGSYRIIQLCFHRIFVCRIMHLLQDMTSKK